MCVVCRFFWILQDIYIYFEIDCVTHSLIWSPPRGSFLLIFEIYFNLCTKYLNRPIYRFLTSCSFDCLLLHNQNTISSKQGIAPRNTSNSQRAGFTTGSLKIDKPKRPATKQADLQKKIREVEHYLTGWRAPPPPSPRYSLGHH